LDVDFSGYIDKFYSKEIFYFNNKIMVSNSINGILKSIKVNEGYEYIFDLKDRDRISRKILIEILEGLVNNNLINLRTLLKYYNTSYKLKIYSFKTNNKYGNIESWQLQMVLIFDLLQSFYGSKLSLKSALDKLEKVVPNKPFHINEIRKYGHLITFLDYRNSQFRTDSYTYKNKELDILIKYDIQYYGNTHDEVSCNLTEIKNFDSINDKKYFPFFGLVKRAYEEYLKLEIIKYKA